MGNGTEAKARRWRVAGSAGLFVAGFTAVFVLGTVAILGMTNTSLITNQLLLQRVGGVVTIIMGLAFIGFIPSCSGRRNSALDCWQARRGATAGCGVRAGLDTCLGPTLTGSSRWHRQPTKHGPQCGAGDRLLRGSGDSCRAPGAGVRLGCGHIRGGLHSRAIQVFGESC